MKGNQKGIRGDFNQKTGFKMHNWTKGENFGRISGVVTYPLEWLSCYCFISLVRCGSKKEGEGGFGGCWNP